MTGSSNLITLSSLAISTGLARWNSERSCLLSRWPQRSGAGCSGTGGQPDRSRCCAAEIVQGVFLAIGFAALSDIHADFVRKARGDVGEDGNKWPRLSPKYLAYGRRFGPGEQSRLKAAAGLGRANSKAPGGNSGLLTASQLKRWRQIYGTRLARFAASMPLAQAKAKAAAIAWATLKAEGAKTKLEVYGNRQVEVLRDTGILLNSLSMGQMGAELRASRHTALRDYRAVSIKCLA